MHRRRECFNGHRFTTIEIYTPLTEALQKLDRRTKEMKDLDRRTKAYKVMS